MASVKAVLRKNKIKQNGTCPVAIRITKDRRTKYVFTGYYVLEKDWNSDVSQVRKSNPNYTRLNNLILKKITEVNDTLIEADSAHENITVSQLKQKIKRGNKRITFYQLAAERIDSYKKKGTLSVANAEQSIVNNIRKFYPADDLYLEDINHNFINQFEAFCKHDLKQKSSRTVTNQLIFIRTLFNIAIKEKLVDSKYYPFAGDKKSLKLKSGTKIGLSKEEIERIENKELEAGATIWHARNLWLFSFYHAGIRISDLLSLRWSDVMDGRLHYRMNKNEKLLSLKIPDKAKEILKQYELDKQNEKDYIFPYLKQATDKEEKELFKKTRNATRLINKHLKRLATDCEIHKPLSNHIARHSFGNLAGDRIHPLMLQKLYRHFDLKTTINYQANFIHKDADDALDSVIN